jgi:hypothetical protein
MTSVVYVAERKAAPRALGELATVVCGLIAAGIVVALNIGARFSLDLDMLSLSIEGILPIGGILGGIGAASAAAVVARRTNTVPTKRLLTQLMAVGVFAWFVAHWVDYAMARTANGTRASDLVSFWRYLQITIEHMRLTTDVASKTAKMTDDLGLLGYGVELLQVGGFAVGGLIAYAALNSYEVCRSCAQYANRSDILKKADSATFDAVLQHAAIVLPNFTEQIRARLKKDRLVGLNLALADCARCGQLWVRPSAVIGGGVSKQLDTYPVQPAQAKSLRELAASGKSAGPSKRA